MWKPQNVSSYSLVAQTSSLIERKCNSIQLSATIPKTMRLKGHHRSSFFYNILTPVSLHSSSQASNEMNLCRLFLQCGIETCYNEYEQATMGASISNELAVNAATATATPTATTTTTGSGGVPLSSVGSSAGATSSMSSATDNMASFCQQITVQGGIAR